MANNPNNMDNLHEPFDSKTGREYQKKSVQKRKQNKTVRETANSVLAMPVTEKKQLDTIKRSGLPVGDKPTYKDFVVASVMMNTSKRGKPEDLLKLMMVLGEEIDNTDTEKLNKAEELLGGVDSAID